jgi:hypothetical protein
MRAAIWLSAAVTTITLATGIAHGADPVNTNGSPLALGGYDGVAYFTDGKPVSGQAAQAGHRRQYPEGRH